MKDEDTIKQIVIDPDIRFGKPTIKGTRITVGDILGWLSEKMTIEEIIDDFPELNEDHIYAALAFASRREELSNKVKNLYGDYTKERHQWLDKLTNDDIII